MSSLFAIFVEDMNRNDAASELSDSELQKQINSQFLREHIELKGFLPLAELYEVHNSSCYLQNIRPQANDHHHFYSHSHSISLSL